MQTSAPVIHVVVQDKLLIKNLRCRCARISCNEETVSIKIPAGVVDGMQLKVSGKGNEAPGNGISGDLLLLYEGRLIATLQREGDNLHYDLYIVFLMLF